MENLPYIIILTAGFILGYGACYMNKLADRQNDRAAGGFLERESALARKRMIVLETVGAFRKAETPLVYWQRALGLMEKIEQEDPENSRRKQVALMNIGKDITMINELTFKAARELPAIVEGVEKGELSLKELTQGWESLGGGRITLEEIKRAAAWTVEHYDI